MTPWLQNAAAIASIIMALTVIGLLAALIPVALSLRRIHRKVSEVLDKLYGDVSPILRHGGAIADNMDYISTSVRVDVQQVSKTIAAANRSLLRTVQAAEARINQLNALLEVAQDEAESAFVATASTIRGVRKGINQAFEREDLGDGDYSETGTGDDGGEEEDEEPKPRIKPRDRAERQS